MGMRRRTNKHLPQRLYVRRGKYYLVERSGRWIPLGSDYAKAMAEYGKLTDVKSPCVTMGEVIDKYRIVELPKKAESTQSHQHDELDRLKAVFGDMLPDAITPEHIEEYIEHREPFVTSARHEVSLLSHVFKRAKKWKAAKANPVERVDLPEKPDPVDRYVTDDEFYAVRKLANKRMRVAMDLALLTGLRRGDILALTRENLRKDGLFVKPSKTSRRSERRKKNGKAKSLLFEYTPELKHVLQGALAMPPQVGPGNFILRTRNGTGYTARGFSAIWQRLMAKAVTQGVERFTFKDIRAKNASDSESLQEASDRLGHASIETTKRHYKRNETKVRPLR